jgi:hypothetical protein
VIASGWFVPREKYCWLVADKPNEQGVPAKAMAMAMAWTTCCMLCTAAAALLCPIRASWTDGTHAQIANGRHACMHACIEPSDRSEDAHGCFINLLLVGTNKGGQVIE